MRVITEPIITVSGLRGVVGQSLTPAVAARYVTAFAGELPPGPILVSRDGRESGPALAATIAAALNADGRRVLDAGAAATPTAGVLVRALGAVGGIQISASHNPAEYNGIKLFGSEGRVLPAEAGARVLKRYLEAAKSVPGGSPTRPQAHDVELVADAVGEHLALVKGIVDANRIRHCQFRVVLDSAHGAGSLLGREVLQHLGCVTTILGATPDGLFDHPPEPTEANLNSVVAQISPHRAAIAFCQDPDADRLAIIDEQGRYIGEEKTLAMCVDHVLRSGRRGPIVTNCSTSRMTEDLAAKYGVPFFRSKVGEANVVDVMLEHDAVMGGEGNGGVIDPRVVLVRDSFVGMALVLDAMAARGLPASKLADELPEYAIHKTTIAAPAERISAALDALESHFADAASDRLDGLRLDWADQSWLLVRPSNTEPIVRAFAEARTATAAKELCDSAAAALRAGASP